jgi:hypothetical protein
MSGSTIRIQVLLKREWRTPGGIDEVRKALVEAGFMPTVGGLTSVSADIDEDRFRTLFGTSPTEVLPQPLGARDFGQSGGHVSGPLKVPQSLERYIETISVAPGHTYFQS